MGTRNFFILFFILSMGVAAAPTTVPAKDSIHIRFSTWHPPASREVKNVWEPMLAELKKRSNGRITYTLFTGGALGKGPEHFDIVKNGLSDMGYFTATWTPGRFPLSDVLSLAVAVEGKDVGADIGNAMYQRILKDEFQGVKVIELNGCISAYLWTTRPVRTLEDCKGLRIRSPGGHQTHYIESLGAEPIFMPLGDVYMAMETGTIDGLVTCPPLVLAFKLYEVAKHGALATFGCVTEGVIMNQKSWDRTPDDLKTIIMEVAGNPFATTGGLNTEAYKTMMEDLKKHGVDLYRLPTEEARRWYAGFKNKTEKWIQSLEEKGLPAQEAVKAYNEECKAHGVTCVACPISLPRKQK